MAKSKPSPEERLSLTTNPTDPKMTALQSVAALLTVGGTLSLTERQLIHVDGDFQHADEECLTVIAAQLHEHKEEIRAALQFAHQWRSEFRRLELATMSYPDYLDSEEWRERRSWAIEDAGGRCQVCNSPDQLHVHHRTYERRGYEAPGDLTVLCAECHELFHKNGRVK